MLSDVTLAQALRDINEIRAQCGRPPLKRIRKGYRYSSRTCPIGRSIGRGALVGVTIWSSAGANPGAWCAGSLTPVLCHLREQFDLGHAPELDRSRS